MNPTISAIVPVFNGARFIEQALASIAAQHHARMEIIVVDDASTDGTRDVLRTCGGITLIGLATNSGPSVARNRGLERANGEFVAFLDADDVWLPEKTRVQLEWFRANPDSGFVTGRQETFIEPGCHPPPWAGRLTAAPVAGGVPSAWLVRRQLLERVGWFDPSYRHAEDIDWLTRAAQAGVALESVGEVVFRKRIHDANLTLLHEPSQAGLFRALRSSAHRQSAEGAR